MLERLTVRQTALGASGVRKRRSHRRSAHRRARPRAPRGMGRGAAPARPAADPGEPQHRAAAAAVTDALTTACMLLGHDEIDALCRNSPGVEAWILEDTQLLHFGVDR